MLTYVNAQHSVWYRAGALRMGPVAITGASFSLPRSPGIQGHLTRDPVCTWRGQDLPSHDSKDMIGCEGLGWNLPFGGILQQRQNTFPCPGEKPFRHLSSSHHGPSSKIHFHELNISPEQPLRPRPSLLPLHLPLALLPFLTCATCREQRAGAG